MPDKIITNPVYATELFKAVAPYIDSIKPEVLAYELAKTGVHPGCEVKWNNLTIDDAITWIDTIQGVEFWEQLHMEARSNKGDHIVVTDIDHLIP